MAKTRTLRAAKIYPFGKNRVPLYGPVAASQDINQGDILTIDSNGDLSKAASSEKKPYGVSAADSASQAAATMIPYYPLGKGEYLLMNVWYDGGGDSDDASADNMVNKCYDLVYTGGFYHLNISSQSNPAFRVKELYKEDPEDTIYGRVVVESVEHDVNVGGDLDVEGALTFGGGITAEDDIAVSGNVTVDGDVIRERMEWIDDFMEAAAALASTVFSKCHWTGGGTSGTQTITAGVNGLMVMSTTSTANRTSTLTFSTANFHTNNAPSMEALLQSNEITNRKIHAGFYVDSSNYCMFEFDSADDANNISLITNNAGDGEVKTDSGVNLVKNTNYKLRIEIAADETFEAFIDDVQVAAGHTGTIPALGTYKPYFYVDNKAATAESTLTIDVVKVSQER